MNPYESPGPERLVYYYASDRVAYGLSVFAVGTAAAALTEFFRRDYVESIPFAIKVFVFCCITFHALIACAGFAIAAIPQVERIDE